MGDGQLPYGVHRRVPSSKLAWYCFSLLYGHLNYASERTILDLTKQRTLLVKADGLGLLFDMLQYRRVEFSIRVEA